MVKGGENTKANYKSKKKKDMPDWLEKAREFELCNDLGSAEAVYKKRLVKNSEDDLALSGLAGIACRVRNYDMAMVFANKAIKANPANVIAITYLGVALAVGGHVKQAEICFNRAVEVDPDYPMPYYHLAALYKNHHQDRNKAKELLDKSLKINPDIPDALNLKGVILAEEGMQDEALECYKKALKTGVGTARVCANIGAIMAKRRWHDEAAKYYLKAFKQELSNLEYLMFAMEALNKAGLFEDYYELLQEARRLGLEPVKLLRNEASYWIVKGNKAEVMRCLKEIWALDKDYIRAFSALSSVWKMKEGDVESQEYIDRMEALLKKKGITDDEKIILRYALAKAYDELGKYDKAFNNIKAANDLQQAEQGEWKKDIRKEVKWLSGNATADFFEKRKGYGLKTAAPIFIVGMPRTGTTLIEQILSMHSSVKAGDELSYLPQTVEQMVYANKSQRPYPEALAFLEKSEADSYASDYLEKVKEKIGEFNYFTDKLPLNYRFIGVIELFFPNAKIIHCNRHPLDTCLSIYFQNFSSIKGFYSSLEDIGFVYRQYCQYMKHWQETLSGRIYDISYEKLLDKPDSEVRALLDYCALSWEPQCLEFHKNKRTVTTSSHMQVNQPLYMSSKQRWKNYEKHIKPLITGLSDLVEEYEATWVGK